MLGEAALFRVPGPVVIRRRARDPESFEHHVIAMQMLKVMGKPVDEDAQKVIDSCQTQIKRITLILDGLYEFSRMPQTEKARNDLNKIIEEVVASQDERFKNEGITPEIRYGEDIPSFMLDKDKIATVITHMVSNAVDAMKNQETKKVGISTEKTPTGESVRIRSAGQIQELVGAVGEGSEVIRPQDSAGAVPQHVRQRAPRRCPRRAGSPARRWDRSSHFRFGSARL